MMMTGESALDFWLTSSLIWSLIMFRNMRQGLNAYEIESPGIVEN